ncbi:MAG TPA: alpha/beta hydrolase [Alphaproteobacteria bacterium]
MFRRVIVAALLLAAASASDAGAFEPRSTGVVLLHGKWGSPGDQTIGPLAQALQAAGFLVEQPEMPWSGRRLYDRPWDDAMREIDVAVDRVKARGASKTVIAGMSMGGGAAVGYAALGRPIDAVVLIAPAHAPEGQNLQPKLAGMVASARDMVAAGHGDDSLGIMDFNNGDRNRSLRVAAAAFLSYFAPDGPAVMSLNAPKVGAAPVLWVDGTLDPSQRFFAQAVWPRVPAATPKERVDVICDHLDTPRTARDIVVNWLRGR